MGIIRKKFIKINQFSTKVSSLSCVCARTLGLAFTTCFYLFWRYTLVGLIQALIDRIWIFEREWTYNSLYSKSDIEEWIVRSFLISFGCVSCVLANHTWGLPPCVLFTCIYKFTHPRTLSNKIVETYMEGLERGVGTSNPRPDRELISMMAQMIAGFKEMDTWNEAWSREMDTQMKVRMKESDTSCKPHKIPCLKKLMLWKMAEHQGLLPLGLIS